MADIRVCYVIENQVKHISFLKNLSLLYDEKLIILEWQLKSTLFPHFIREF
jgi:hypothetical protein